jgi:alpha-beta hydrolase superfamily lysophospholipase
VILLSVGALVASLLLCAHAYLVIKFVPYIVYIFQVRPIFKIPQGEPVADAERVTFKTADGLTLHGCYLRAHGPRKGVILFGPEFGSNCWSCIVYCDSLRKHGYDIFSFELRGQGDSEIQDGYEPLQWVTNHEVVDFQAALAYLKSRPDADSRGIGFFGISKGGGAGLLAAIEDAYIRCCVTDGIFATEVTMVPYMRKWIHIYSPMRTLSELAPRRYYGVFARIALKRLSKARQCTFPHLEQLIQKIAPRPLLMIHGGSDTYIKPEMARQLFERAGAPKEFWLVENAKHNQSVHVANGAYQQRLREFFDKYLSSDQPAAISDQPAPLIADR